MSRSLRVSRSLGVSRCHRVPLLSRSLRVSRCHHAPVPLSRVPSRGVPFPFLTGQGCPFPRFRGQFQLIPGSFPWNLLWGSPPQPPGTGKIGIWGIWGNVVESGGIKAAPLAGTCPCATSPLSPVPLTPTVPSANPNVPQNSRGFSHPGSQRRCQRPQKHPRAGPKNTAKTPPGETAKPPGGTPKKPRGLWGTPKHPQRRQVNPKTPGAEGTGCRGRLEDTLGTPPPLSLVPNP